jgi:hypothetical protein
MIEFVPFSVKNCHQFVTAENRRAAWVRWAARGRFINIHGVCIKIRVMKNQTPAGRFLVNGTRWGFILRMPLHASTAVYLYSAHLGGGPWHQRGLRALCFRLGA